MKMTIYAYFGKLIKSTSVMLCLKLPRVLKYTLAGKEFHMLTTLSASVYIYIYTYLHKCREQTEKENTKMDIQITLQVQLVTATE